jgi:hypothetical protein
MPVSTPGPGLPGGGGTIAIVVAAPPRRHLEPAVLIAHRHVGTLFQTELADAEVQRALLV